MDVETQNICVKKWFFSVRCIIPLFHPPIGVYTRYFSTLGAIIGAVQTSKRVYKVVIGL